jgi:hypothetical protein
MMAKDIGWQPSSSTNNAAITGTSAQLVRVTHPFPPLSGQRLQYIGTRYTRYGKKLLLRVDDTTICSVPPQWTDIVAPDPEVMMGRQRALFRVADLLELASLLARLPAEKRAEHRDKM